MLESTLGKIIAGLIVAALAAMAGIIYGNTGPDMVSVRALDSVAADVELVKDRVGSLESDSSTYAALIQRIEAHLDSIDEKLDDIRDRLP